MLSGWTAAQTATTMAATLALIGSTFTVIYTVRAQRKRAKLDSRVAAAAEEIEYCKRRLSEFYRPLMQHRSSSAFLRDLLPDHPWRLVHHLEETKRSDKAATVDMIIEEGDKIVEIIRNFVIHHEVGPCQPGVRACLLTFVRHHTLLRKAWHSYDVPRRFWRKSDPVDLSSYNTPFPLDLDKNIRAEVEAVQARIRELHLAGKTTR